MVYQNCVKYGAVERDFGSGSKKICRTRQTKKENFCFEKEIVFQNKKVFVVQSMESFYTIADPSKSTVIG